MGIANAGPRHYVTGYISQEIQGEPEYNLDYIPWLAEIDGCGNVLWKRRVVPGLHGKLIPGIDNLVFVGVKQDWSAGTNRIATGLLSSGGDVLSSNVIVLEEHFRLYQHLRYWDAVSLAHQRFAVLGNLGIENSLSRTPVIFTYDSDARLDWAGRILAIDEDHELVISEAKATLAGGLVLVGTRTGDGGNNIIWMAEIDDRASVVWSRCLRSSQAGLIGDSIEKSQEGDYYVTGHIDPSDNQLYRIDLNNTTSILVASLDVGGSISWLNTYGPISAAAILGSSLSASGNELFLVGNRGFFPHNSTPYGILLKLSTSGDILDADKLTGYGSIYILGFNIASDDILLAVFDEGAEFVENMYSSGAGMIMKLTSDLEVDGDCSYLDRLTLGVETIDATVEDCPIMITDVATRTLDETLQLLPDVDVALDRVCPTP